MVELKIGGLAGTDVDLGMLMGEDQACGGFDYEEGRAGGLDLGGGRVTLKAAGLTEGLWMFRWACSLWSWVGVRVS